MAKFREYVDQEGKWDWKSKESQNAYKREWRRRNLERSKTYHKRWQEKNPDYWYGWRLKNMHGLTREDYERMLAEQQNLCAICKTEGMFVRSARVKLYVDHDHVSGKIRQLLCNNCNSMLGMCNDSTDVLRSAIEYIECHKSSN